MNTFVFIYLHYTLIFKSKFCGKIFVCEIKTVSIPVIKYFTPFCVTLMILLHYFCHALCRTRILNNCRIYVLLYKIFLLLASYINI